MEKHMIDKIEKCLENLNDKKIEIQQSGFIATQFCINKLIYKIQNDIINLRDKENNIYISINLNQAYQIEIGESKLKIYLDNDTEIRIEMI